MRALRHRAAHLRGGPLNFGPAKLFVDANGILFRQGEENPWEPTEAERARVEAFADDFEEVVVEPRPIRGPLTVVDPLADLEAATKALAASDHPDLRELAEAVKVAIARKLEELGARRRAEAASRAEATAPTTEATAPTTTEAPAAAAGKGKGK